RMLRTVLSRGKRAEHATEHFSRAAFDRRGRGRHDPDLADGNRLLARLPSARAFDHDPGLQASLTAKVNSLPARDVLQLKVPAGTQRLPLRCRSALGFAERLDGYRTHQAGVPVDCLQRLLHVKLPALALGVATIPIEQAESGVARLLHFR